MTDLPYSSKITVADLPPLGTTVRLEPDAAIRAALARHVEILDLPAFRAELKVAPEGAEGAVVTGTLTATVRQTCVVTLEPFDAPLAEDIEVHFAPESDAAAFAPLDEDDGSFDPPDMITDGTIDLGGLVTEYLSLGIDPYPRKPGAVFEQPQDGPKEPSPFAALAQLKNKN